MKRVFFICSMIAYMSLQIFPQTFKTLEYLKSIAGQKTIAGQHNREPNSQPAKWTDSIYSTTGKYPGLWSADFLFEADNIANRWTMIYEAKNQWDKGAIVQLMFHTCPPTSSEPCGWNGGVLSTLTDAQWTELITNGTTLNTNWKNRLDIIAPYLQYLEDNGVEVLFRPLHEMNQGAFWWGGRPGVNGTARLYQITHDYLTITKGLTNLIWVWDMQDIDKSWDQYNPGDAYWDILGFDVYSDGYSQSWYNYAVSIAGSKPLAIGECATLPTALQLASQPRYVFFMAWAELAFTENTITQIKSLYKANNVITLDEMPGWTNVSVGEGEKPVKYSLSQNYPNPFNPSTTISYDVPEKSMVKISAFNLLGQEVALLENEIKNTGRHEVIWQSDLNSGIYFYRLEEKAIDNSKKNYVETKKMILLK